MRNKQALTNLLAVLACTTTLASAGAASAVCEGCAANTIEEICTAGAAEGTLVREATPDQESGGDKYVGKFTERYKIPVKLTAGARTGGSLIPQRMLTEAQAGRAFISNSFQAQEWNVAVLLKDRFVQKVDWVALGFPKTWLSVDADHRGLRNQRYFRVLAYNSNKYTADQIPNTWEELADAKWAGKIAVDPTGSALSYLAMKEGMGIEAAKAWFDKFLRVAKPVPFMGTTTSIQAIATGQFDISTNATLHNVVGQTKAGLPVAYKYLDYTMTSDLFSFVVAGSKRANAAVCFSAWWSKADGGAAVMKEIEGSTNDDRPADLPAGRTVVAPQSPGDLELANTFADYIASKMGR